MSWDGASWETQPSLIARAFRAALQRANALEPEGAEVAITDSRERRALMLSGTDLDPHEVQLYVDELAAGYVGLLGVGLHPREVLRGALVQAILIGDHYGVARTRVDGAGAAAGRDASVSSPLADELTIAQRRDLGTDAVQTVLDLEADHLERVATSCGTLGLNTVADLMRAAAIVIRDALETRGLPPVGESEQSS